MTVAVIIAASALAVVCSVITIAIAVLLPRHLAHAG